MSESGPTLSATTTKPTKVSTKILVVDDDHHIQELSTTVLGAVGFETDVARDGAEALQKIESNPPHLVLLDINMVGLDGLATIKRLREKSYYISVIFVSGLSDTKDVVAGLEAGADDYLRKPFAAKELVARVQAQLRIKDLRDELLAANEKLKTLVDIDDLTGLYNMRSVYDRIDTELSRCQRHARSMSVVMLDMDHFKQVNDKHDHLFGSYVLKEVGEIIRQNLRQSNFAARYGGDEFLICLTEADQDGTSAFCQHLKEEISATVFSKEKDSIQLTVSMGAAVTSSEKGLIDARALVRSADHALYQSKDAGRNCIHIFSDFDKTCKKMT